ncbi:conserved unknown protein [Nannochloropsis gaditana]|uniref:Ubiquitin-like domain-containing protein n=1 Tax=Nannochloropsis gaditana TaxID=72520 RepID=W7T2R4_9STRA|nr:conserved unknown protein [Nannochloropsis gaditana]
MAFRKIVTATFLLVVTLLCCCLTNIFGTAAPVNVVVTLRGKKYDLSAESVQDIQAQMEGKSGLKPGQQAILFKGKQLGASESLSAAGVVEGDTLNIVPTKGDVPRAPPPRPRASFSSASAEDEDLATPAGVSSPAAGAGPSTPDELLAMLNGMLGNSGLGGLAGASSPEDAAKVFQGMDMGKVAKMYQAFIWKLVRSPIVARYLSSEEDMEQLRLKLKESFENVSQDPKVAAQMAPFLNDDFRAMMEDTRKFREEIQKVVDFYMKMPDPDADGSAFSGLDMSMFEGLAKSPDEDASDDLDNLGDEDEDEGDGEGEL